MEGETNRHRDPGTNLEQDICIHIFTVSSAMVGVCLTVIGLIVSSLHLGVRKRWQMIFWPETRCFS